VGLATLALTSCGTAPITSPPKSFHSYRGIEFEASFIGKVRVETYQGSAKRIPQYGVGVLSTRTFSSGRLIKNGVDVQVELLSNIPPMKRLRPFLRYYLHSPHGDRDTLWQGHIAEVDYLPPKCENDGVCSGELGAKVISDGTVVFKILVAQPNLADVNAYLNSFEIVDHH